MKLKISRLVSGTWEDFRHIFQRAAKHNVENKPLLLAAYFTTSRVDNSV